METQLMLRTVNSFVLHFLYCLPPQIQTVINLECHLLNDMIWPLKKKYKYKIKNKNLNFKAVFNLQKNCKHSTESSLRPHVHCFLLLTTYVNTVHLSQLMSQIHYY